MEMSIVVPIYNEESILKELCLRLISVVETMKIRNNFSNNQIELIIVNDGSTDNSLAMLISIAQEHKNIKVLNLSRNFGHQIAVTAGIEFSTGNFVVLIDGDLQDPPEVILNLYEKIREGYDVVYAIRKHRRGEGYFKLFTAKIFYRVLRRLTNIDIPMDTGDFRIMRRNVVSVLNSMQEKHRFVRGMVAWIGFRQTGLHYERHERFSGASKYPLFKMIRFAWDAITSFSIVPIRIVSYLGFLIAFIGALFSIYIIFLKIFTDQTISGWSSVMIAILFMSGINLITIGVIGEYVSRISEESKNRPLYIIENIYSSNGEGV